jgi:16S rRNA (uracil1498-N3)-methyltransferase
MKKPPWLLVPPGKIEAGAVIDLDAGEGRHAIGPLRLRSGDPVVIADGRGGIADAELVLEGRKRVSAVVVSVREAPEARVGREFTLALAVLEGKAMDWAVQKAVEVGVGRFQPLLTQRTQRGRREPAGPSSHLERIALQALKQCRRPWAMEILPPRTLAELVEMDRGFGGVVADPEGSSPAELSTVAAPVLAVGPEGGFSSEEVALLSTHQWHRVRLGDYILRSETAAIVGSAMILANRRGGRRETC